MKKTVLMMTFCLIFALLGCTPQPTSTPSKVGTIIERGEFLGGPVRVHIRPNFGNADYEIEVDPWQVDVKHSKNIRWILQAPDTIAVQWEIRHNQGPWPEPEEAGAVFRDEPEEKEIGPFNHPGGDPTRGKYYIWLKITDGTKTTVLSLDPDHRVWP